MKILRAALAWLYDPANWSGQDGILVRVVEHVNISLLATLVGVAVAMPVGMYIGHRRRFEFLAVTVANLGRAIPSFGILAFVFPFTLRYLPGIGYWPTLIALILLSIPPVLTNTYVGIKGVDADTVEAARAMGMTEAKVLRSLELPLAAPLIVAGVRTAAVQVVATATLGAVVGWGGLGRFIVDGIALRNFPLTLAGSILVAVLAIATEAVFGVADRLLAPPGTERKGRAAPRLDKRPAW